MNGRQEHDLQFEKKIQVLLKGSPEIIRRYSYDIGEKTASTRHAYISYLNEFSNFHKGKDLASLKRSDVNQYLDAIRYKDEARTIENSVSIRTAKLAAVKDFYRFLVEDEVIQNSPAATIKPPKHTEEHTIVAMTPMEIKRLKHNIMVGSGSKTAIARQKEWRNRDLAIVTLGCATGLRCSSLVEINIEDIDFEERTIRVTEKGNKTRSIYIGENTAEIIKNWMYDREEIMENNEGALFVSNQKRRMSQKSVARLITKYSYNIDKHLTPHKMRSSCATNLYGKTHDIYLVQEVLGDNTIDNTIRNATVSDENNNNKKYYKIKWNTGSSREWVLFHDGYMLRTIEKGATLFSEEAMKSPLIVKFILDEDCEVIEKDYLSAFKRCICERDKLEPYE